MWIFLTNLKNNLSNLFMNWTSCVCFSIQQKDIWRDTWWYQKLFYRTDTAIFTWLSIQEDLKLLSHFLFISVTVFGALCMMPWICATCATVISIWSYRLLRKMLTHSDTKLIWHRCKIFTVNKRYFKLHMISISTVTLYLNFYVNSLNSMLRKIQTVVHYTTATELNSPANLRAKMLFRE